MFPDGGEGLCGSHVYCKYSFDVFVTLFDLVCIYGLTKLQGRPETEMKTFSENIVVVHTDSWTKPS